MEWTEVSKLAAASGLGVGIKACFDWLRNRGQQTRKAKVDEAEDLARQREQIFGLMWQEIGGLKSEQKHLFKRIDEQNEKISALTKENAELRAENVTLQGRVEQLEEELHDAREKRG